MKKKIALLIVVVVGIYGFLMPYLLMSGNNALVFLGVILGATLCFFTVYSLFMFIAWFNKKHKLFDDWA